jgi:hypothetical protein
VIAIDREDLKRRLHAELSQWQCGVDPAELEALAELVTSVAQGPRVMPVEHAASMTVVLDSPALLETLAAIEHERWSGWMKYQAEHCILIAHCGATGTHRSGERFDARWLRQARTPYADLSEAERESDRIEARKTLAAIKAALDGKESHDA